MQTERGEQCDAGSGNNITPCGPGCGPGCTRPPFCGDAVVSSAFGERCDDGENAGGHGECAPGCQYGPRCGDAVLQPAHEDCDDGNHQAGDGCSPSCRDEVWVPQ